MRDATVPHLRDWRYDISSISRLAGGGIAKQEVPEFESELYTRVSVPVGKTLLIRGKGHWVPEQSGLVGRELLVLMKAEIVEGEVNEFGVLPALR